MTHASLFSGIGGFDLAAEWCGWDNVFQVEIEEFPTKVLERHWPNVKRFRDIKKFDAREYRGTIDVLSGGFPCQPFSVAGKRRGKEDDRYLWPEMVRVIQEVRPRWVVGENVVNGAAMELHQWETDLEGIGYEVATFDIPASALGLSTMERHIWVVAPPNGIGLKWIGPFEIPRVEELPRELQGDYKGIGERWNLPESRVCRSLKGIPNGLDRIKALGNAIVPQVAYEIFKAIDEVDKVLQGGVR